MRTLISGGSSDIGRALVERRLAQADDVAITTTKPNQPPSFSKTVRAMEFQLQAPEQNSRELQDWIANGIDALVLSAASRNSSLRRLHEYDPQEITAAIEPNLYGNIWLLQKCLEQMQKQGFGRILFISSIAVYGSARYSLYSAAKSAIEGIVKGVATDYGEFNITANIIRPGVIETERTKRFWKRTAYVQVMMPLIPANRFGRPEDIATASDIFLARDCYANGVALDVSGGLPQIRPDSLFKVGL